MKRTFFSFGVLFLFAATLSFVACNSETPTNADEAAQTEQEHSHEGHDHDGHDHADPGHGEAKMGGTAAGAADAEGGEVDKTGPEYASAYVCPMHCKGSGSASAGKCPECGMDYVENPNKANRGGALQ